MMFTNCKQIITAVLLLSLLSSGANAQQLRGTEKNSEKDSEDGTRRTSSMVYSEEKGGWVMSGSGGSNTNAGSSSGRPTTVAPTRGPATSRPLSTVAPTRPATSRPLSTVAPTRPATSRPVTTIPPTSATSRPVTTPGNIVYNPYCARVVSNAGQCFTYEYPLRDRMGRNICVIPLTEENKYEPGCPGRGVTSTLRGNPDIP